MSMLSVIPGLQSSGYRSSSLHDEHLDWVEKNCYIDVWIEVIHALGLDPLAMLSFVVAIDYEGDQWTFFKPPHDELRELYGIDIQELNVWRPLLDHLTEHLAAGKIVSTEADAFWLPDTQGTDYRRQHSKTTIAIQHIDPEHQRLGYFHNTGYYELLGEDYRKILRADEPANDQALPLYAEIARTSQRVQRPTSDLKAISRRLLQKHLLRAPPVNPVARFSDRLSQDMDRIVSDGIASYHRWAFASVRQLGAAFELAALHLDWLRSATGDPCELAIGPFRTISTLSKTLLLKTARAVNKGHGFDTRPLLTEMSDAWEQGITLLRK